MSEAGVGEYDGYGADLEPPFGRLEPMDGENIPDDALSHGFEREAPAASDLEAARAKGWTTRTIVFAALVLALLNAHALQSWATTLPPDWGGQTVRALADAWYGRTAQAGLDQPRAALHDAYQAKKDLRWGDLEAPDRR